MYDSSLSTAKYLTQNDEPDDVSPEDGSPELSAPPAARGLEHITSRLSWIIGGAGAVCALILILSWFGLARDRVNARAEKSTSAIDWFLWFGGAKEDETFEKFVTDTIEKNQTEWEEILRESPAFNFENDPDFREMQRQLEAQSNFRRPNRGAK